MDKSNYLLFPEYKDYDQLKDLLRKGKKDEAKSCIEKGCLLDKDCTDNTYDGTPLHLAVSLQYPDIVELLLEKGADTESLNDTKDTPLLLAAIVGNIQIIDIILSKIKPKNYSNSEDLSHLHIACMRNDVDLVQKLLASGAGINKSVRNTSMFWPGFTPLHFAVEFNSTETAKFLIDNEADITFQDNRDLTPLHLAFRKRNIVLTDLLLSKQYYYASNPVDSNGLSHFHIACAFNKKEIVEDFLKKKIDSKNKVHIDCQIWHGYGGLHFAIRNQCIDVLEYLLKCDPKIAGSRLRCAYKTRHSKVVNLIISSIEKEIVHAHCSHSLKNSLNEEEVDILTINQSIKTTFCNTERFSMSEYSELHVAVLQKNLDQVRAILDVHHPSIVTVADSRGKTPIHLAFETNQKDIVKQLLTLHSGLDENPADSMNLSHFHISCATNQLEIMENFIRKGVDVNMPINMDSLVWAGNTPLHLAIIHCHTEAVKLLISSGADFTLKNALGLSSYDLAIPDLHEEFLVDKRDEYSRDWKWIEEMLLANEDRKLDNFDNRGITLLHIASINGDIDMIKRYVNDDTINKTTDQSIGWWSGFTPLHFAAFDAENAFEILLNNGADPAIENCQKNTVAHYLFSDGDSIDDRIFLLPENVFNEAGISVFHAACRCGNFKGVQHFLKMGVDVHERSSHNCSGDDGQTPLHFSAKAGHSEIVKLLLDHGADVNARDFYFNTPLRVARKKEVLQILLHHGADPEALNSNFHTALELETYEYYEPDRFVAVLESGWDINDRRLNLKGKIQADNYADFARHVERLAVLGFNISEQNIHIYNSIIRDKPLIRSQALSHKENCAKELNLMKEMEVDGRTTLYDVLFKSSSEMSNYSKNENLQKMMEQGQDLRKKYPIYANLVILQFIKGTRRANLLEEGKQSLSLLMNRWMDDLVFEAILQFMNDHEITFLNYAAKGRNIFNEVFSQIDTY